MKLIEIKTGYLYYLKDEFYKKYSKIDKNIMPNKGKNQGRPTYFVIKKDAVLWFVPLSLQIEKYKKLRTKKIKRYGKCSTILTG